MCIGAKEQGSITFQVIVGENIRKMEAFGTEAIAHKADSDGGGHCFVFCTRSFTESSRDTGEKEKDRLRREEGQAR